MYKIRQKPFTELQNPIVRLWIDKHGRAYKLEVRHDDFMGYFDLPENESEPMNKIN